MKGLQVATCPWRKPEVARAQIADMVRFREGSTPEMRDYFQGIILTSWSSAEGFMKSYYKNEDQGGAREMLTIFEMRL